MSAVKLESSLETDSWTKPYRAVRKKMDSIAAWSTADFNHTMFYFPKCFNQHTKFENLLTLRYATRDMRV